jgi:ATP phosphoribosyltransferase regulatory subunit HisZ
MTMTQMAANRRQWGDLAGVAAPATALTARVDRLARDVLDLTDDDLHYAIIDLGRVAAAQGHAVVAALAASMRANLADSRGRALVSPYLRAMRDAIEANSRDVAAAASWVASVNVRLNG